MVLTVDSSVIVAALRKSEPHHGVCLRLMNKVKDGSHAAIQPYSVLVEVVAAIKRRTGSEDLALQVKRSLLDLDGFYFLEIESFMAGAAADLAAKTSLRGMDALVGQVAIECDAHLVTLDAEMADRLNGIVKLGDINVLL